MNSKAILQVQDLQILDRESRRPICEPVNFELNPGEIRLLTGVNGVGKSSLLRAISSTNPLGPAIRGSIKRKPQDLAIHFHPQASALQFAIPVTLADVRSWTTKIITKPTRLLEGLDLSRPWDSSSGGEKQRLLLDSLLSISAEPAPEVFELLLLDEPTNHLDKSARQIVADEIRSWIAGAGKFRAAVIVSHDIALFQSDCTEMLSTQ